MAEIHEFESEEVRTRRRLANILHVSKERMSREGTIRPRQRLPWWVTVLLVGQTLVIVLLGLYIYSLPPPVQLTFPLDRPVATDPTGKIQYYPGYFERNPEAKKDSSLIFRR